eukprot:TRINITY_DN13293_c0_g1_i1.p1 TRINITY_DN13293_c0_g1~~TRINITY_DN13293_c0_g1_i1.p1  ORF type:complete len:504 (-),score=162.94 TRINITY_DN13293_c0_g1_i1:74-1540(-)
MSASRTTKNKQTTEDVEGDIIRLEKRLRNAEVKKEEIDSKAEAVTDELNMLNNELVKAKRQLDENSVDKDTEEKRKKNLEIDVRHLVALKAQKYKDIRNLQTTVTALEWKLNEFIEAQQKHEEQTQRELASVEKSRSQLEFQKTYDGRKMENEQRVMQAKFLTAKQELNRQFQRDYEAMRQHYEVLIDDMNLKHKSAMDAVDSKQGAKIAQLKSENIRLRREYDATSLDIKVLGEKERRMAKQLEREQLISEVNQTNDVSWVNKADVSDTSRRSALIDMERVISDLRQRCLEEGDEYNVANQQRVATQKALRKAKQDLAEHQALLQHMETSKKDLERRLNKRISELQGSIERANKKLADEHNTKKASLQVEADSRMEEAKSLAKQCADMEAELIRNGSSTASMASRLDEKLQLERDHVLQLETEKREAEVNVRLLQFEVESLKVKLTELEQEMNRLKSRVEMTTKELQDEEDKNNQLEVSLKQLEAKI